MNIIFLFNVIFFLIPAFCIQNIFAKEQSVLSNFTSQKFEFGSIESSPDLSSYLSTQRTLSKEERKALERKMKEYTAGQDRKRMSLEQLEQVVLVSWELKDHFMTLLYLDQLFILCKDVSKLQKYKRMRADIFFEQGKLADAELAYKEYCILYPGAIDSEEVHYRLIVCLRLQMCEKDQDQTKTREVIKCADQFLEKEKVFKIYALDVAKIRLYAYKHLYDHEVGIFDFYLKNQKFPAAQGRLAHMRQDFIQHLPHIEADLLHQEYRLASVQNDQERMNRVVAQLERKYPMYTTAVFLPAQGKKETKKKQRISYVNRF